MSQLKSKNKIKRIIYSWPVLILLLIIVILIGKGIWTVSQSERLSSENKNYSEDQYNKLKNKSDTFLSEIEMLETEKGVEAEIRDKFRVVKAGEQLAIIINADDEEKQIVGEAETIWTKIWNLVYALRGRYTMRD